MDAPTNVQVAPYPHELDELVATLKYRPGWTFRLTGIVRDTDSNGNPLAEGLTFIVTTTGWNSYHRPVQSPHQFESGAQCADCGEPFPCAAYRYDPERDDSPKGPYRVNHYMPVPAATYDRRSWRRWLFEQLLLIERHETAEFFEVDDERPYAPSHGPGNDPYIIRELGTDIDRRTSFRGELSPA